MPIRAAIFDIGATLVTGPPVAPNKVIAKLLDGVSAAQVGSIIMTHELCSADHVCEMLADEFGCLSGDAQAGIFSLWHAQATAPQALDGARDTVLTLKSQGFKIGLLSDIWNPYYEGVQQALPEVIDVADTIVLSCRSGFRKPHANNFQLVLERLGVNADEAVMIGDTYTHDIEPALKLGMRAVWVLARPDRESESIIQVLNSKCPAPTATVSSISEVMQLRFWGNA